MSAGHICSLVSPSSYDQRRCLCEIYSILLCEFGIEVEMAEMCGSKVRCRSVEASAVLLSLSIW
jgi:hypothetical protein